MCDGISDATLNTDEMTCQQLLRSAGGIERQTFLDTLFDVTSWEMDTEVAAGEMR